jgi:hypothetical protein
MIRGVAGDGFVNVVTHPAGAHSLSVPGLGTFAPGAGPAVGSDGTLYLGTLQGHVIALHADGSPFWNRQLPSGTQIIASPAVGADQSVYVVGVSPVLHDHRGGQNLTTYGATLYKFTAGGGAPQGSSSPFPDLRMSPAATSFGPRFTGEPSVWQFGADESVMVPAGYPTLVGQDLHVLAFAPSGGLEADVLAARWNSGDVSGDAYEWPIGFTPFVTPPPPYPPLPGLGVSRNPQGGTPFVTLADRLQSQIVGFTFCVGASCSPAPGFTERFRTQHAPRVLLSAPTTLPDLHTAVGSKDGVVFSGPSATSAPPLTGLGDVFAAPTVAADGRVILVSVDGSVTVVKDHAVTSRLSLSSPSVVRAVASRTHVFVATQDGFHTLDATAQSEVLNFPWNGGGIWPPAIGPDGRVYAMASNVLFIFPPPPPDSRLRDPFVRDVVR